MAAAEVYSPTAAAAAQQQQRGKAASQAWRAVVGWIGFLLQVLLQILRGTPSCAQLLSFVGFRYPLLSGPAASEPSPEVAFMPLHSEIPADADAAPAPIPAPEPLGRLTVRRFVFCSIRWSFGCPGWGKMAPLWSIWVSIK
jgi:RNA polymerase II subunit A small phosphatase-like protein